MSPEKTTLDVLSENWPMLSTIVGGIGTACITFWTKLNGKASRGELSDAINGVYSRINELDTKHQKQTSDIIKHSEEQRVSLERHITNLIFERAAQPNKRSDDQD